MMFLFEIVLSTKKYRNVQGIPVDKVLNWC